MGFVMRVARLNEQDIIAVCETVNTVLIDSVEASFQLNGLSDKWGMLQQFTLNRIKYWQRIGEVWIVGENEGLLAGHYGKSENALVSIGSALSMIRHLFVSLSKDDKARLMKNLRKSSGAENVTWRKAVCKGREYFFIDLIAISQTLKGSGAFRFLMEPIIIRMEQERIPILLDTHDKDNVPLYQHFGFTLIHQHQAKHNSDLIQYSMVKHPL